MIDPVAASFAAMTARSPASAVLVFAAGAFTSFGPCVAPRYLAVAALVHGRRRPIVAVTAFIAGLVGAFVALGFVAGMLGTLWSLSSTVYTLMAGSFIGAGCIMLVRADGSQPAHDCTRRDDASRARSNGGVFLLGAASAFIVSPCCTPVVGAIVGASTAIGSPLTGAFLLLCFALGHALPLLGAASANALAERWLQRIVPAQASAIIGAVLMTALGVYFGVLA